MVVTRLGAARTIRLMSLLLAAGLVTVAVGYHARCAARSSWGCSCSAFGNGTWDVAMNVEGAAVEQHSGPLDHVPVPRRLQPRHGRRRAASGSAMVALHVGVTAHLLAVAVVVAVAVPISACAGSCRRCRAGTAPTPAAPRHPLRAWTSRARC